LVRERLAELEVPEVRQVLRNPFVSSAVIEILLSERRLLGSYEVRRDLASHRKTPQVHALRLLAGLYWRDLARIASDTRAPPTIRKAAERQLSSRLPGLAVGEKIAVARAAGPGAIALLRSDPSPRVVKALLENPRMTEGSLLPLVSNERTRPEILTLIANDARWGNRYRIRLAICRNSNTAYSTALRILPLLKKSDLTLVARDRHLSSVVRRRADLLLGRQSGI
jgi:hypothetical protein